MSGKLPNNPQVRFENMTTGDLHWIEEVSIPKTVLCNVPNIHLTELEEHWKNGFLTEKVIQLRVKSSNPDTFEYSVDLNGLFLTINFVLIDPRFSPDKNKITYKRCIATYIF